MKVLITGIDGYLGWPLAMHLAMRGHEVAGIDNFQRRQLVNDMGSISAFPIASMKERLNLFERRNGCCIPFFEGDLTQPAFQNQVYRSFQPEAVVYLGQMPSAPFSMLNAEKAIFTQTNNVSGALATLFAIRDHAPDCHLVKLGTMGEYGTPNVDIPEGFFEVSYRGREARMMFPRQAGSWYHQSKVHDSHNVEMASRLWGIRATDVMQGVVYGTRISDEPLGEGLHTRFDFDGCFGTVIHRFCVQALLGLPLTPYGNGTQKRGFLPLRDSMTCLTLAVENPPERGEYRTFNQFDRVYSINSLAKAVQAACHRRGMTVTIQHSPNPRIEAENHYYNPDSHLLRELGYAPSGDLDRDLHTMLEDLEPFKVRLQPYAHTLTPKIQWAGNVSNLRKLP